ncbi:magnesium chelatase [Roseivirga sp. BDSF3-8]|uniref:magnesium chelatase n=1 Tax=Roseivirga sp. BDSF3-8 TaxID=3241598 RepID=UPI00353226A7
MTEYKDLNADQLHRINTLGQLKATGYSPRSIKKELRDNLVEKLRKKENVFEGIWGYEDTVIPDIQRAILSMHNMNLLGLRGQAKTRIARMMTHLLDEYIPVLKGSELNDDPMQPLSRHGHDMVKEMGDDAPVSWLHRSDRYTEKLATPDVSVADLVGDVDPIKAATLKLPYSDERVLHYGLIPRSHRGIFVINELPDLQARIQVALFNILQEGDMQIRGFKLRLPLDIQFVFTANPEDYTNRGSIVTPLKDRIDSQIITHYPMSLDISRKITEQEANLQGEQKEAVFVFDEARDLIEQVAIEARDSEYVDPKSGVSARLTISAFENLVAAAERRRLVNDEGNTHVRLTDFHGVVPAITGKVELVYEGEQEGAGIVAHNLIGKAIRTRFATLFPDPDEFRKQKDKNPYREVVEWFGEGNVLDLMYDDSEETYHEKLESVPGLSNLVKEIHKKEEGNFRYFLMEFALHGLSEYSQLSKKQILKGTQFKDLLSSMFSMDAPGLDDEDEDDDY